MQDDFDDAVRERHGVACRDARDGSRAAITIWEDDHWIYLDGNSATRGLTPHQARYLAAKIYRLSRRIRARGDDA